MAARIESQDRPNVWWAGTEVLSCLTLSCPCLVLVLSSPGLVLVYFLSRPCLVFVLSLSCPCLVFVLSLSCPCPALVWSCLVLSCLLALSWLRLAFLSCPCLVLSWLVLWGIARFLIWPRICWFSHWMTHFATLFISVWAPRSSVCLFFTTLFLQYCRLPANSLTCDDAAHDHLLEQIHDLQNKLRDSGSNLKKAQEHIEWLEGMPTSFFWTTFSVC